MMKTLITSDTAPAPAGPYSAAVRAGDWLYLAGQGGFDPNTGEIVSDDIAEQTEQLFRNIKSLLDAAGATFDDIVSCLVHLTDLSRFPQFNEIYARYFEGIKPVRTTVRADLVAGMLIEITAVAYLGE